MPAAESTPELDDDGPNPLPPALDTAGTGLEPLGDPAPTRTPVKVARATRRDRQASAGPRTTSGSLEPDDSKAIGIMDTPGEREPRSMPEDILPGARVITPESSAPIVVNEAPDADSPPVRRHPELRTRCARRRGRFDVTARDADSPESADSSDINGASTAPRGRPGASCAQPGAKCRSTSRFAGPSNDASATADRGVVTLTSTTTEAKPGPISASRRIATADR